MRTEPLSLLFVCTANISRSPYAERRARMLLGGAPVRVASAGVPGLAGRAMDPHMADQLEQRSGDPDGHLSRCLSEEVLAGVDILLTFEYAQNVRIVERWPDAGLRTFGLRQFDRALAKLDPVALDGLALVAAARAAESRNSVGWDIDDPHGRGRRAAKAAAREIDAVVQSIVSRLIGEPTESAPVLKRRWPGRRRPWRSE